MDGTSARLTPGPESAGLARFRPFLAAAALAVVALLTAACGGGSASAAGSSDAGQVRVQQGLAFAHCMRSHGVPNFPDPDSSGGIVIKKTLLEPAYRAPRSARTACAHLLPKYGLMTMTPAQEEQHQRQQLAMAACMRRHGFPQFPDNWSGNVGQLQSAHIDPNSPQLNAELPKCRY
jgi:hypothetical protein